MVKIILTPEIIEEIPDLPSVYALVLMENDFVRRFVGFTHNLRERIKEHFDLSESDADLRSLMGSGKTKLLCYELQPGGITEETRKKAEEWTSLYNPRKILIRDEKSIDKIANLQNRHLR